MALSYAISLPQVWRVKLEPHTRRMRCCGVTDSCLSCLWRRAFLGWTIPSFTAPSRCPRHPTASKNMRRNPHSLRPCSLHTGSESFPWTVWKQVTKACIPEALHVSCPVNSRKWVRPAEMISRGRCYAWARSNPKKPRAQETSLSNCSASALVLGRLTERHGSTLKPWRWVSSPWPCPLETSTRGVCLPRQRWSPHTLHTHPAAGLRITCLQNWGGWMLTADLKVLLRLCANLKVFSGCIYVKHGLLLSDLGWSWGFICNWLRTLVE